MKIKTLVLLILVIVTILLSIYLKMKYDEKKAAEEKYYNQQKDRIELFMKYNVKDFKSVDFTSCERDPMGGYAIKGYINNNKKLSFTASAYLDENNQFEGDYSSTEEFDKIIIKNPKTVSEIKKEEKNKQNEN
ncbi:DUF1433 domain-containing protein [Staphylococcus epidermidis]|jgi:hypothetical protein|uniref:DUF1433 domain-containing protein n=1 Tax=Staphylococcus equorum TaxID=246432 RepID=A0A9X4LA74_9STAP|nr:MULTISPECIES: DUF1433 domain-containing protein [Staphylococcus]EHM66627.1 hypothetical protein SEVCU071_0916 [Staphylococcus epidermidis VCU071]KAB2194117.1 DUF1433 domain-containing protein [Staphylococcus epidermidis]MBC3168166.1 DUF1433 domain-containing protein [Staphylococcus epidermidis]MBE0333091.1 DUF1433 domain-containing protein [Staphylococcus epidermidis]MBM0766954.1 DUF1433 domain-containing protein [Staphylococcus epidermidis]